MNQNLKKIIDFIEEIQIEGLEDRFGKNYLDEFNKLKKVLNQNGLLNFLADNKIELTENDVKSSAFNSISEKVILTKYELPISFSILKSLFEKIQATAENTTIKITKTPYIGTSLSKEYNAFACKVPNTNDNVIIFESELFTLANLTAKLIASCLPDFKITKESVLFSFEVTRIKEHIKNDKNLKNRFSDFIQNAIYLGEPNKTQQYFLDKTYQRLHYELLNSLELFVVAHEYGHISAGHLENTNNVKSITNENERSIILPDWEEEYEADEIGLFLLLNSLDKESMFPFSYLGPELFFTILDLDERACSLYSEGKEKRILDNETHPPSFERRNKIRNLLKKNIPKNHLESYLVASKFLENIIELLWDDYKK